MWRDYFNIAVGTFTHRKMRTFLTLIGIIIGIAAVVALISLGQGLQAEIGNQFNTLGADKIFVIPGNSIFGFSDVELLDKDFKVIERVNGVDIVSGIVFKLARVKKGDESIYTWVWGLSVDDKEAYEMIVEMIGSGVVEGRDLKSNDRYSALGTVRIYKDNLVFDKPVKVGDKLEIEGQKFKIVGGLSQIGNPQDDSAIIIPLETARDIFNEPEKWDQLFVQVKDGVLPSKVAEEIKKDLRKSRDVDEGDEDFTVQTTEEILETFSSIFNIISIFLIGIAGISLLVGGVGIMNTMYTSVLERTQEIGIMKAIGAKNKDVFLIFVIEAGIVGLVGGIIGILVGVGLSKLVAFGGSASGITLIRAEFPPYLIFGSLAFAFIVGCAAGALPAMQAAKLNPVEALRYE